VGAGRHGEYIARATRRLERTVAIKILPHDLSSSPALRQRFGARSQDGLTALAPPHLRRLRCRSLRRHDYLVMEFLEGEVLSDRLSGARSRLDDVLRHGIQIADALDRAHRSGIVTAT